jgi:hypothetical protein
MQPGPAAMAVSMASMGSDAEPLPPAEPLAWSTSRGMAGSPSSQS